MACWTATHTNNNTFCNVYIVGQALCRSLRNVEGYLLPYHFISYLKTWNEKVIGSSIVIIKIFVCCNPESSWETSDQVPLLSGEVAWKHTLRPWNSRWRVRIIPKTSEGQVSREVAYTADFSNKLMSKLLLLMQIKCLESSGLQHLGKHLHPFF